LFFLEKAIKLLISLPSLMAIFFGFALLLYFYKSKKHGKKVLISFLVLLWCVSTRVGKELLVMPLVRDQKELKTDGIIPKCNILVLGGGCRPADGNSLAEQLSHPSLRRVLEGFRIKHQLKEAQLILSGIDWNHNCNIAQIGAQFLSQLASDSTKILELNPVRNTREEANLYFKTYGSEKPLILVTSALHMPRALRNFKKLGINTIPAPTDFPIHRKTWSFIDFLPAVGSFETNTTAWTEWMALLGGR